MTPMRPDAKDWRATWILRCPNSRRGGSVAGPGRIRRPRNRTMGCDWRRFEHAINKRIE